MANLKDKVKNRLEPLHLHQYLLPAAVHHLHIAVALFLVWKDL